MKKVIITLAAVCLVVVANATILRVSNVSGSSAPYSTLQAAHDAATVGDTIMVDGSDTDYGNIEVKKSLVFIGPGFWINENGIVDEAAPSAKATFQIAKEAKGTVIEGFYSKSNTAYPIKIYANNCIIRRCYIYSGNKGITIGENASAPPISGVIVHQNFLANSGVHGLSSSNIANVQVTNNIFVNSTTTGTDISGLINSYIAYNTMIGKYSANTGGMHFGNKLTASTIEHNILTERALDKSTATGNEMSENYVSSDLLDIKGQAVYSTFETDKDIRDAELAVTEGKNYGAFAGDSPYVLSGIPAAPVIQDLVMPTTVEKGKKMNVTIKVGIQK